MFDELDNPGGDLHEDGFQAGFDDQGTDILDTTEGNNDIASYGQFNDYEVDDNDDTGLSIDDSWTNDSYDEPREEEIDEVDDSEQSTDEEFNFDSLDDDDDLDNGLDDSLLTTPSQNKTEEDILKELEAKGYQITAPEDQDAVRLNNINQVENEIGQLKGILNYDEVSFIKLAARQDLIIEYQQNGKENQIDSELFQDELQSTIDELELSPSHRRLFLNNHRGSLQQFISQKEGKLAQLKTEHQNALDQKVFELKKKTEDSVLKFAKEYKLKKQEALEVYKFIGSDEYKALVNNTDFVVQSVAAELARRKGQKLFNQDDTYARGVKDALDEIKSNGVGHQSKSLLGRQMQGSATLSSSKKQANVWQAFTQADVSKNEDQKPRRAAGRF